MAGAFFPLVYRSQSGQPIEIMVQEVVSVNGKPYSETADNEVRELRDLLMHFSGRLEVIETIVLEPGGEEEGE